MPRRTRSERPEERHAENRVPISPRKVHRVRVARVPYQFEVWTQTNARVEVPLTAKNPGCEWGLAAQQQVIDSFCARKPCFDIAEISAHFVDAEKQVGLLWEDLPRSEP